jgi:hypothetical protein
VASPDWLARTLHDPVAMTVIVRPLTVQASSVSDASETVSPELDVAPLGRSNDEPLKVCEPGSGKVMVCEVLVDTENVWLTGSAAPYVASPAWVASIVHDPVATVVIDRPLTVQIPVVSEVSVTVRPDDAVAPEANVVPGGWAPGLGKVID